MDVVVAKMYSTKHIHTVIIFMTVHACIYSITDGMGGVGVSTDEGFLCHVRAHACTQTAAVRIDYHAAHDAAT